jgi:hypothetical protein
MQKDATTKLLQRNNYPDDLTSKKTSPLNHSSSSFYIFKNDSLLMTLLYYVSISYLGKLNKGDACGVHIITK